LRRRVCQATLRADGFDHLLRRICIQICQCERSRLIEWLRLPGDLVFIIFGTMPLVIASIKCYVGVRAPRKGHDSASG
jgi:hypothetical protein